MITRIKIDGFKNLHQTEVHFGPFTCIAGANAVGKSNLFDAIRFLSYLADMPLLEAARSVRSEVSRQGDVSSLFRHHATAGPRLMTFEVDMIVPETGHDDLGQPATASITTLQYRLEIGLQPDPLGVDGQLEILKEELLPVKIGDAKKAVLFDASANWKKSVVRGRRIAPLISSEATDEGSIIRLHQDGKQGNLLRRKARHLPRTVLSTVDAVQYPTASLARREMRSWHLLQLEPSSLRQSDSFDDFRQQQVHMDEHGRFLPATLYRLHTQPPSQPGDLYQHLANRLAELIEDVVYVEVRKDDQRQLLTLYMTGKDGIAHPARSLSDGTLRFLGLATIEQDPHFQGVLCLEEPENGIHPEKIPAMLRLLQDIAFDPTEPVGEDNPMRQVIINTHSPLVVQEIPADALLLMTSVPVRLPDGVTGFAPAFHSVESTWRMKAGTQTYRTLQAGDILAYLSQEPRSGLAAEPTPPYRKHNRDSVASSVRTHFGQLSLFD